MPTWSRSRLPWPRVLRQVEQVLTLILETAAALAREVQSGTA